MTYSSSICNDSQQAPSPSFNRLLDKFEHLAKWFKTKKGNCAHAEDIILESLHADLTQFDASSLNADVVARIDCLLSSVELLRNNLKLETTPVAQVGSCLELYVWVTRPREQHPSALAA